MNHLNNLPEKWCIKRTPGTNEIITKWFNENTENVFSTNNPSFPWIYYPLRRCGVSTSKKDDSYTEIQFRDFLPLVENQCQWYKRDEEIVESLREGWLLYVKGIIIKDECHYIERQDADGVSPYSCIDVCSSASLIPVSAPEKPKRVQTFGIVGPSELLHAIWKRLREIGYNTTCTTYKEFVDNISQDRQVNESKKQYMELYIGDIGKSSINIDFDIVFTLPEQYNEALAHAEEMLKDEYWEEKLIMLPFGETNWKIDVLNKCIVSSKYGRVSLSQILAVKEHLLGLTIQGYSLDLTTPTNIIKFGCQEGTVQQMNDIINAFD